MQGASEFGRLASRGIFLSLGMDITVIEKMHLILSWECLVLTKSVDVFSADENRWGKEVSLHVK